MPAKKKISVTVASDVVAMVDRAAREAGTTRSYTIERWLRMGGMRAAERSLEESTAAYYATLHSDERAESDAIATAASRVAPGVDYDGPRQRKQRRARSRR